MTIPRDIESGGSQIAVGNGQGGPSGGAGPVERITVVQAVLPCPGCAHAPVCAIRPLLDPEKLSLRTPAAPHEAIRIRMTLELECEHFLATLTPAVMAAAPVADRMAVSRQRGAAGLVKAREVKAERHQATGGGSGEATIPDWDQAEPRGARADATRDGRELRTTPGGSVWIGGA